MKKTVLSSMIISKTDSTKIKGGLVDTQSLGSKKPTVTGQSIEQLVIPWGKEQSASR